MPYDPNKSRVGQTVIQEEGPMLLESRAQPLFDQSGKKRFEHSRDRGRKRYKYPQGNIVPDFVECPTCGGKPNDVSYIREKKDEYKILARCFKCGAQTLPFLPRLAIPIVNSRRRKARAKRSSIERAMEVAEWYSPDSKNQGKDLGEFLDEQGDVLDSLLNSPVERVVFYVSSKLVKDYPEPEAIAIIVNENREIVSEKIHKDATANQAGLLVVLEALKIAENRPVLVESSNKYVVNWSRDLWKANNDKTNEIKQQVLAMRKESSLVEFVPEHRNFADLELIKRFRQNEENERRMGKSGHG